jgi:hypothetical protein
MWNLAEPVTVSFVCELQLLAGLPAAGACMVLAFMGAKGSVAYSVWLLTRFAAGAVSTISANGSLTAGDVGSGGMAAASSAAVVLFG